jgi:phage terminase large subunit GpA-like protein
VIHHRVVFGHFTDPQLWVELDDFLLSRFPHPHGGTIGVDGAVVDAGDGDHSGVVMDFCNSRDKRRHIWPGKGYWGATRMRFAVSKEAKQRCALIGVDALKGELFDRLQNGSRGMHFSNSLEPVFFKQLASEHRVVRLKSGMPVRRFERVSSGARAEALDCLVYATASMIDVWKVMPFADRIARFKLENAPVPVLAYDGLHPDLAEMLEPDVVPEEKASAPVAENYWAEHTRRQIENEEKVAAENRASWL